MTLDLLIPVGIAAAQPPATGGVTGDRRGRAGTAAPTTQDRATHAAPPRSHAMPALARLAAAALAFSLAAPALAAEVDRREENHQDRIAQGVKSGQLTPGETAHLERKEAGIRHEIKSERAANGGKLTPAQRAQVNRQQNRVSNQIYRAKHNDRHM